MMTNYLNKVNKSFFSFDKNYVINNIERAARISIILKLFQWLAGAGDFYQPADPIYQHLI